ncbi:MAG: guanylate kinase [Acidobacteria bacterium]|jgi:guanylate kinase|nr:MAG: guanylate kinase [Acidobacteriota bacterium]GIU82000.1 MAG: guanylate kinase [Pyrinomonadaceae bacterium]
MKGSLFIISAPSGGGKGTLIREVLKRLDNVVLSVSFTTRPMRQGEEHGKDYFFVSHEEFKRLIEEGEFLEYAEVHGNFYGTSRKIVEDKLNQGYDVILEIDVQGAAAVKKLAPQSISIFILPPSYEVLRKRLLKRGTETAESLKTRLENARREVKCYKDFDYVVINDKLSDATKALLAIFLAERQKLSRQASKVEPIIESFDND